MTTRFWNTLSGGLWSNAANWLSMLVPAAGDDASITGPSGTATQVITGPGAAAAMTFLDNSTLDGAFTAATLFIGDATGTGVLALAPGATLTVAGALTFGGAAYSADTLTLSGGAKLQAASVVLTPGGADSVTVDSTSAVEVGTAGGAAAGTITVDAGATLAGAGGIAATGGIVDQGTITAQGRGLAIASPVTGGGIIQIGAGATLTLSGRAASTVAVAFSGAGGTLAFGSYLSTANHTFTTGFNPQGVITGFAAGDTLSFAGANASSATYRPGAAGSGTLTVAAAGVVLGTLTLAGDYSQSTFLIAPAAGPGFNVVLVPVLAGGSGAAAAGTAHDAYAWAAAGSGNWGDAGNWSIAGSPAAVAPGTGDDVTITGGSGTQYRLIDGPGNSASLTLIRNVDLAGAFATGALVAGPGAGVVLNAGASLGAASVAIDRATMQANGARLTVNGQITLGDVAGAAGFMASTLYAVGGAVVQAGGLSLLNAGTVADTVSVDAQSVIEIGSVGGAAAGTLTVDAGHVVAGSALSLSAANGIVNNGTIVAQGPSLTVGAVSGAGQLQIAAGAALVLGDVSTQSVAFMGAAGGLTVSSGYVIQNGVLATALNERGVVSGFAAGDTITVLGAAALTGAQYAPGGNGLGTLTLFAGATAAGTLTLAGNYGGATFQVGSGGVVTVTAPDPLFDAAYYLAHNPDVAAAGVDPYTHYLTTGWKEGRNPDAWFDTRYYLATNPDVAAAGINPLAHFETYGWHEGRQPSLLFSDSAYLAANPDVAAAGNDPLAHFIAHGQFEGRQPILVGFDGALAAADPMVSAAYFDAQLGATLIPPGAAGQAQAAEAYANTGWKHGLNPNAWFDTTYYLTQNPDVAAAGIDPLQHFETNGWKEGRDPSLVFSASQYLAANPDVKAAGIDPLAHYIMNGHSEGRTAFLTGGTLPADPLVSASYYDAQLGATIQLTGTAAAQQAAWSYDSSGWQKALNPDAWFNTTYYLTHNPDVAAAHIDPLLHYETHGWKEGRDPSALFSTNKYLAAYGDVKAAGLDPLLHYMQFGQGEGRTAFAV